MAHSATLLVYRNYAGVHTQTPTTQLLALDCIPAGYNYDRNHTLTTVIIRWDAVNSVWEEITTLVPNTFQAGDKAATKILNNCNGEYAYVVENINDVSYFQDPCCDLSGAPIEFGIFVTAFVLQFV